MKPIRASWSSLKQQIASAERLFLFLDYDGTLAPIAGHPSKARLSARTRRLLKEFTHQPGICVALVSGRSLRDLKKMVRLPGLLYIGNHGLELQGPKLRYVHPVARESRPLLQGLARLLKKTLSSIPGVWVEDKGFTLSVHYRSVAPDRLLLVENKFFEAVGPSLEKQEVRVTEGKRVLEVHPAPRWTKGTAIHWLLTRCLAGAGAKRIFPIYIGDDQTDEDAFEALKGRGITIAVGSYLLSTQAEYTVRSPQDVHRFLRLILRARDGTAKIPAVS